MNSHALKEFMEKIANAGAPLIRTHGVMTGGDDVTQELQANTFSFAKAYMNPKTSKEELQQLAKAVEGSLITEEVLAVISDKYATALIDELQDIVEQRLASATE